MHSFRAWATPGGRTESGRAPAFFYEFCDGGEEVTSSVQTEIEARLQQTEPDVELLLVEVVSPNKLRLFIDHADGVTLDLCERVSHHLNDYREQYSLEVSSPGQARPLTKPQHFSRF